MKVVQEPQALGQGQGAASLAWETQAQPRQTVEPAPLLGAHVPHRLLLDWRGAPGTLRKRNIPPTLHPCPATPAARDLLSCGW